MVNFGKSKATMSEYKEVHWICTTRVALAIIAFLGFVILYALRVNMSVALVCMVNHTAIDLMHSNQSTTERYANNATATGEGRCASNAATAGQKSDGEFIWDKETQGVILGAFFYGYLVTQLPGGILAQKFGGKRVLGYFLVVASTATLFCGFGARYSPYMLIFLRVIIGMGSGFCFPSMHDIWAKWAPPMERTKLIGFTHAGAQIGNVIALPLSALLCDYGFDGGWPSIFYILGILGIIWCVMWLLLVSDTPAQHPRITAYERKYIETSIGGGEHHIPLSKTPWLSFAKSPAVWAICAGHTAGNWGSYTLLTNLPAYMKEVLKFDIKSNGLFSAIPYVLFWFFINVGGVISDMLRQRGWKTKTVRKIMMTLGTICPGLLLIATGYVPCEQTTIAVAVLSIAVGLNGLHFTGALVNHVDIAPPFAGVLFGISNTMATIPGFIAPYVVKVVTRNSTQEEWQIVFYITCAVYTVGAIIFCLLADGEIQDWALPFMGEAIEIPDKIIQSTSEAESPRQ